MIYLYAKQHNKTGLRYFGKTIRDPYKYNGSGLYWRRHLKVYGKDITTTWVHAYDDLELCEQEALFFSKVYNIVDSDEWANIKPENGKDGWPKGVPNPRVVPQSEETRRKKSEKLKGYNFNNSGPNNPNYGKPMPIERKIKLSQTKTGKSLKPWSEERRAKVAATWALKLSSRKEIYK